MTDFSLSLYIDHPARLQVLGDFSATMQEVRQTSQMPCSALWRAYCCDFAVGAADFAQAHAFVIEC